MRSAAGGQHESIIHEYVRHKTVLCSIFVVCVVFCCLCQFLAFILREFALTSVWRSSRYSLLLISCLWNLATLPEVILYKISFYLDELTILYCEWEINQRMYALFSDQAY
jgi:hypothetical protein